MEELSLQDGGTTSQPATTSWPGFQPAQELRFARKPPCCWCCCWGGVWTVKFHVLAQASPIILQDLGLWGRCPRHFSSDSFQFSSWAGPLIPQEGDAHISLASPDCFPPENIVTADLNPDWPIGSLFKSSRA